MDPHQDPLAVPHLAFHQGHVDPPVQLALVGVGPELAVVRWDQGLRRPANEQLPFPSVSDEVGDRDELQAVGPGHPLELGEPGHGPVGVHDLADHAGREQPG